MPHKKELMVKITMQSMKKFFRPITLAAQAPIGKTMALATRYEVRTQVLWSALAPRLPAMGGSATFAIEVSSTSIKAARATVAAMSHGFVLGFQAYIAAFAADALAVVVPILLLESVR